ncbi:ribonuclease H-like domain-containing protein [Tanacetum coccineum]
MWVYLISGSRKLKQVIGSLHAEFFMTNLSSLNYFFGISAQQTLAGMSLSQSKYVEEILDRAYMMHCNPCRTLVDTESKLGPDGFLTPPCIVAWQTVAEPGF